MKNVYLSMGALLIATGSFAQARQLAPAKNSAVYFPIDRPEFVVAQRGGSCIFSEDFEGGAIPAGWDIGAQVEQLDANGNPLGTFVDAWVVGDSAACNNGGFFDVPNQPTGNLFAFCNDDGPPCDCAMNLVTLVTPSIDLSGQTGLGLSFRAVNDGQYATSEAKVWASTDGGATWTDIFTIPEVAEVGGVQGVWQQLTIPITAYEGLPDVRFRWTWTDGGEWGTGLAVDDVCVSQISANNITLNKAFIAEVTAFYEDFDKVNQEYSFLADEQAYPMVFGASVTNNGGAVQTNIVLSVTVGGNTFTSAPYPSLAPATTDTILVYTTFTPSTAGQFSVSFSVEADQTDSDPSDNTGSRSFTLTGAGQANSYRQMGLDNNSLTGFFNIGQDQTYLGMGGRVEIQNSGSFAHGIGVAFATGTSAQGVAQVTLLEDTDLGLAVLAVSDIYEIQAADIGGAGNNNIVYIPFDAILSDPNPVPVALDPAKDYICIVENPASGAVVRLGVSGTLNPGGLFSVDPADGSLTQYIGTGNPAGMIRLFLDGTVGINELSNGVATLNSLMPNPANQTTVVSYTLEEGRQVSFEVIDAAGRKVMAKDLGRKGTGRHMFDLDVTNMVPGLYQFVLTTGDSRVAQRLVVTR